MWKACRAARRAGRGLAPAAERVAARQLWCVPPPAAAVTWPLPRSGARVVGTAATIESWRLPPTACDGHGAARGLAGSPLQLNAEDGPERDEEVNPFALVEEELAMLAERMRTMVSSEVPKLASAAEYFFGLNAQGKRFRPAVLLLMASAFSGVAVPPVRPPSVQPWDDLLRQRQRQQRIAEITEMIHVASLLHDDVLDLAETRRGVKSLNYLMGNKLAVLAGDFLLARASVALASLQNTDVVELLSRVLEHLVSGEIMQMTAEPHQCCSMEYYLHKTFCKTGSLIANGCKAVAILGNQPPAEAELAYCYGRHLGLAFQLVDDALDFTGSLATLGKPALSDLRQGLATAPALLAAEEYPAMLDLVRRKFVSPGDIDQALAWVRDSRGIERTHQLAAEHAAKAAAAINAFPPAASDNAGTQPLCLVLC
eukprot:SM000042S15295  [mRNA]  locus=s42:111350:113881:- [translate_table: standard]